MFDLEQAVAAWREQMLAAGILSPGPLEELEGHLREEIGHQTISGLTDESAFFAAAQAIGHAKAINLEFKKIDTGNWNRPLAWTAWACFAVSFFLPAYADGRGWQCAGISATAVTWPEFRQGNWLAIHLSSLTLANLLMIASPFLLPRFSSSARGLKWLRLATFTALAMVWSFLLILATHPVGDGMYLKYACYLWGASFLLLCLSTLKTRTRTSPGTRHV